MMRLQGVDEWQVFVIFQGQKTNLVHNITPNQENAEKVKKRYKNVTLGCYT